jgi:hypothetical protein
LPRPACLAGRRGAFLVGGGVLWLSWFRRRHASPGSAAPDDEGDDDATAWRWGGAVAGGRVLPAQIWALRGPIWVWAGQPRAWLCHLRWMEEWLGLGVAWTGARRLQRGAVSLTSPRARPGQVGLVCSCAASGLLPSLAGEVVPSCGSVVQPPLAPGCLFSIRRSRYFGHG